MKKIITPAISVLVGIVLMSPPSHAAICEYQVQNQWSNGFTASIRITNDSNSTINGWSVNWQYSDGTRKTSGWNAVYTGNNPYTASNYSWNGRIAPNASVEFGFQGTKGVPNTAASIPVVSGDVCGGMENQAPIASFTVSPATGTAPLDVFFDASGSTDPDGDTLTYSWDFGDGTSGSGTNAAHTYGSPGTFTATLTVSDGNVSGQSARTLTIDEASTGPNAGFTYQAEGKSVTFIASDAAVGFLYEWDFGDNNSATGQSVTHTFANYGNYDVTLTVTDSNSQTQSNSQTVTLTEPSDALINADFEADTVGSQPAGWDNFVGWVYNNQNNSAGGSSFAVVDDSRAFSGSQSVHFRGGISPAQIVKPLPTGTNKLFLKAMVYMTKKLGNDPGDNHEHIFGIKATPDANNEVRFGQIKGHIGTNEVPSDNISPRQELWNSGPELNANQWTCVVLELNGQANYDEVNAWLDGTLVHTINSADDWNNGALAADWLDGKFNYVMFGWHSFSGNNADVWMDDIVVSESPVSCQ